MTVKKSPVEIRTKLEFGLRSVKFGFEASDWQFKDFTRKGPYTGTLTHKGRGTVIRDMYLPDKV